MSNNYILENSKESVRLEKQSQLKQFSIEEEAKHLTFPKEGTILDAGCGSGLASRFINEILPKVKMYGCDLSEERLKFAISSTPKTKFFCTELTELTKTREAIKIPKFNFIFNRYVAHHMNQATYQKVLQEFYDNLTEQGAIGIVDIDGVLVNLGTINKKLQEQLSLIQNHFSGDLFMARKIPNLLREVGFKDINYHIETVQFDGDEKTKEIAQYEQRIDYGKDLYIGALGSEDEFVSFKKTYLQELETTPFYYNKFIIQAYK